ncbi:hypothetical protein ABZ883_14930 [Streptomyces sp. NPDC046977]|uniref:DUF7426 family protein n=1 Tax=Streptomyces sp. NPDC046977 TaxID=3154703 RepID=UPI0033D29A02
MAARFDALDELFDDSLELPVGGKTYRIPSPSAEDGLKVQKIANLAVRLMAGGEVSEDTELLDDDGELDLIKLCLGPVYDELTADGVSWAWVRHLGMTSMLWITQGIDTARNYWKAGGDPSQMAPNREARRAAKKSGSAAASKTRSRGSTSGTSARPAGKRSPQVAKA